MKELERGKKKKKRKQKIGGMGEKLRGRVGYGVKERGRKRNGDKREEKGRKNGGNGKRKERGTERGWMEEWGVGGSGVYESPGKSSHHK